MAPPVSSISPQFAPSASSLAPPSVAPRVPRSSPSSTATASFSHSVGPRVSLGSHSGTSGTSGASHEDVLYYVDADDRSEKEDSDSPVLDKAEFSKCFQEMINLITGIFHMLSCPYLHILMTLWLDSFGNMSQRSQCVFLKCFDKLRAISKEVSEKFQLADEDKKKSSSSLPQWGQVYHLGDEESFHMTSKVNDGFSRLLTNQVSSSRSLSLSLDDSAKSEACIRGQI